MQNIKKEKKRSEDTKYKKVRERSFVFVDINTTIQRPPANDINICFWCNVITHCIYILYWIPSVAYSWHIDYR